MSRMGDTIRASRVKYGLSEKQLAKKTGLHEKSLYKTLSRQGNPLFSTVLTIMSALGLRLVAEAKSA